MLFLWLLVMGILRTQWSPWSAHLHVNFQNASPTLHHAIVMLLCLFCLGTNGEEGLKVGQHSVLALPRAESLPSGVQARLFLHPSPSSDPLSSRAELGGLLSFLEVWSQQAVVHGNAPALGHKACESVSGGNLTLLFLVAFQAPFPLTPHLPVNTPWES